MSRTESFATSRGVLEAADSGNELRDRHREERRVRAASSAVTDTRSPAQSYEYAVGRLVGSRLTLAAYLTYETVDHDVAERFCGDSLGRQGERPA